MKQNQYKELKETLHLNSQEIIVRWGHGRFYSCCKQQQMIVKPCSSACFTSMPPLTARSSPGVLIGAGKPAAAHLMKQSFQQAFRALKLAHADTPIVFDEDLTLELLWRK